MPTSRKFTVVSGGSGCNAIVGAFQQPSVSQTTFVIPVSDDGGSSAEVQRVLGGPSVGDLRSRLVRLIPSSEEGTPLHAIRTLMEHRLPGTGGSREVKAEWHAIVEGRHKLWKGIPPDRKEAIRAFLVHVEAAILRKAQRGFNWKRASVGNLFLTGASMFLGSIPSAIFLFASITEIPHERFRVIPVINTASTATIAAELESGEIIVGQSEISHPSTSSSSSDPARSSTPAPPLIPLPSPSYIAHLSLPTSSSSSSSPSYQSRAATPALFEGPVLGDEEPPPSEYCSSDEDVAEMLSRNVFFSKDDGGDDPLPARIRRVFYLNAYGTEIFPRANPLFLASLAEATCLVYSCGSLYTSILPCLALRGVGQAIHTSRSLQAKVLLLNTVADRETPGYTAVDFVEAVRATLSANYGDVGRPADARDFVTHVAYLEEGNIPVDVSALAELGIVSVLVKSSTPRLFDEEAVLDAFSKILGDRC